MLAAAGIIAMIGTAGMSDFGSLSNAEVFLYGGVSFLAACVGIWGAMNCTRAIEAAKRRARRVKARNNVIPFPKAA